MTPTMSPKQIFINLIYLDIFFPLTLSVLKELFRKISCSHKKELEKNKERDMSATSRTIFDVLASKRSEAALRGVNNFNA